MRMCVSFCTVSGNRKTGGWTDACIDHGCGMATGLEPLETWVMLVNDMLCCAVLCCTLGIVCCTYADSTVRNNSAVVDVAEVAKY